MGAGAKARPLGVAAVLAGAAADLCGGHAAVHGGGGERGGVRRLLPGPNPLRSPTPGPSNSGGTPPSPLILWNLNCVTPLEDFCVSVCICANGKLLINLFSSCHFWNLERRRARLDGNRVNSLFFLAAMLAT